MRAPRTPQHTTRAIALLLAAALLSACVAPRRPITNPAISESSLLAWAFAAESIRVHPLTQLELEPGRGVTLACHVEVRDRWGDTVKAVGDLQVQLYRPVPGLDATREVQELVWDIDLNNLERNAAWFDPVTRTYRVRLTGLPAWAERIATGEASGEAGRLRLRAVLRTVGPDGRERILRDDLIIQR